MPHVGLLLATTRAHVPTADVTALFDFGDPVSSAVQHGNPERASTKWDRWSYYPLMFLASPEAFYIGELGRGCS